MRDMRDGVPARIRATAAALALVGMAVALAACSPVGMVAGAGAGAGIAASQERGFKGAMDDQAIRLDINHLWFQESMALYRDVNLQVQEGRVLLTGTVPDEETRLRAVALAWQADGVREVINEIEVAEDGSLADAAQDRLISAKLKSRLLADADVDSINYSIETVNGAIYLIGIARSQAELDRVIAYARDIPYVRRVVNYVRVKDADAAAG